MRGAQVRTKKVFAASLVLLAGLLSSSTSFSDTRAHLNPPSDGSKITGLSFDPDSWELEVPDSTDSGDEGSGLEQAILRGRYVRPNWVLTLNGRPVRLDDSGNFAVPVRLFGNPVSVTLVAQGPFGVFESEKLVIDWRHATVAQRHPFSVGLGVASINYQQTNIADYSEAALDFELGFRPALSRRINLLADISAAYPALTTTRTDVSPIFLSGALDFAYALYLEPYAWRLDAVVGMRYSQVTTGTIAFGYTPLLYPEYYPALTRSFGDGSGISIFAKFIPINSLSETEFGCGGEWTLPTVSHPVSLWVNYSSINYYDTQTSAISNSILAAGVRYGL